MNKSIPFGYHYVGSHTIIKLNMNLTPADADEIRNLFGFSVIHVGRYGSMLCRIEAVVPWNGMGNENFKEWFNKLEIYKVNAQMEKLALKKADLLDKSMNAVDLHVDLTDLPF
jgi:hypothetical protein